MIPFYMSDLTPEMVLAYHRVCGLSTYASALPRKISPEIMQADILPLLTENPARLLKVYDRIGSIAEGKDADLVILDEKCDVERTFAKGRLVFAAGDVG